MIWLSKTVFSFLYFVLPTLADVTIYTQVPFGTGASTSTAPLVTNNAFFDPTTLSAPAVPTGVPNNFQVQLSSSDPAGLGIKQSGSFLGFSVELSVADQIFGKNGTHINPPFLNLLQNLKARAGKSWVRVGGNSQERAVFFPQGLAGGATILKDKQDTSNPTNTPTIQVGIDLIYAMGNISSLVNTQWWVGVPFNDTNNPRLGIAESSEQVLGQYLLGLQVANEPDLYPGHFARSANYQPSDFVGEYGVMMQAIANDGSIANKNNIAGPSICCNWSPEQIVDANFLQNFANNLGWVTVEHYPNDNCKINGNVHQPQDVFSDFLNHTSATSLVQPYLNFSSIVNGIGKPLVMMETNTASCGGFPGVSDSFGAALWGLDFALQMAYTNFSGAMMHVGGQNVFYNPFTPPPGKLARQKQWTIGPMYYVALIMAEVLGKSGVSQVTDLGMNNNNMYTPGYAIYENGAPTRVALFNFITDPSGANNYTAQISIGGSSPSQVYVRYFTASSTAQKIPFNWAGSNFGGIFESNGVPAGSEEATPISCSNNNCAVSVPAPGFALVFLSNEALSQSSPSDDQVFATTAGGVTFRNTATINPSVLATSNGHGGTLGEQLGSTSFGSSGAIGVARYLPGGVVLACLALGGAVVGWSLVR